ECEIPPDFTGPGVPVLEGTRMRRPPHALADLVERHRPEILRYLVRLLGNEPDAQDACQDVFLKAHRAFGRLVPGSNCRAWLYRAPTNGPRTPAPRRPRRPPRTVDGALEGLPAAAGPSVERGEELDAVRRAVRALPPRQRAALLLRQFEGLDYAAIAESLG